MKKIIIAHLYPDQMNIYGDMGNIIALQKRLEWRGYTSEYHTVKIGENYDFTQADIVFGGGGQDSSQMKVADDLVRHKISIKSAVEHNVVFLLICGLYQLFGNEFTPDHGLTLPGIGVFDMTTVGSDTRMIGNVVVQSRWGELVGFENHSGKTTLNPGQSALGRVIKGNGNNGGDRFEGAVKNNAFGTYMHGSLLPKNPHFADEIIKLALGRESIEAVSLAVLDDQIANLAANEAKLRPN